MLLQTQPTCHEKPSVPDRSGARCVAAVLHPGRPGRGKPADCHGQHPDARHRESRIERHGDRAPRERLLPAQKLDRHFFGQLSANPRPEIHAHRGRRHNARLAVLDAEVGPRVVRAAVSSPAPRNKVVRLHRIGRSIPNIPKACPKSCARLRKTVRFPTRSSPSAKRGSTSTC